MLENALVPLVDKYQFRDEVSYQDYNPIQSAPHAKEYCMDCNFKVIEYPGRSTDLSSREYL